MRQHGLMRSLKTSELSEARFATFFWLPPCCRRGRRPLMILNEPETSLHPDLLPPLARLIARASEKSQIIVVSHAAGLVSALHDAGALQMADEGVGRDGRAR